MNNLKRIITIDLLRGYFLFVIIIDHLGRYPGLYEIFTGKGWLWVSAAEGFFFISGLMLGLIRGKKDESKPFWSIAKKLIQRGILLYLITISLTLIFSYIANLYTGNPNIKYGLENTDIYHFLFDTFTLNYVYGWADFLKYYAVYILLSPIAVLLLRKKLWPIVLLISFTIWFFFRLESFTLAWQILFYFGMVIGYYFNNIIIYISSFSKRTKYILNYSVLVISLLTLIISIIFANFIDYFKGNFLWEISNYLNNNSLNFFDKSSLPLPRLIIFSFWFTALFILFTKFENTFLNKFSLFGKNSLFVYVIHSFFIFFVNIYFISTGDFFSNVIIDSLVLITIIGLTKMNSIYNIDLVSNYFFDIFAKTKKVMTSKLNFRINLSTLTVNNQPVVYIYLIIIFIFMAMIHMI